MPDRDAGQRAVEVGAPSRGRSARSRSARGCRRGGGGRGRGRGRSSSPCPARSRRGRSARAGCRCARRARRGGRRAGRSRRRTSRGRGSRRAARRTSGRRRAAARSGPRGVTPSSRRSGSSASSSGKRSFSSVARPWWRTSSPAGSPAGSRTRKVREGSSVIVPPLVSAQAAVASARRSSNRGHQLLDDAVELGQHLAVGGVAALGHPRRRLSDGQLALQHARPDGAEHLAQLGLRPDGAEDPGAGADDRDRLVAQRVGSDRPRRPVERVLQRSRAPSGCTPASRTGRRRPRRSPTATRSPPPEPARRRRPRRRAARP